jgi:CxxC motif-containing protein
MSIRNLTCIGCPMGCALQVEIENGVVTKVTGNTCKRGEDYGRKECTNPTRIVTSSVTVEGGEIDVVPVKTQNDVPKEKIFDVIREIRDIKVKAPVKIGDIILKDVLGTGVNIIATKNINRIN